MVERYAEESVPMNLEGLQRLVRTLGHMGKEWLAPRGLEQRAHDLAETIAARIAEAFGGGVMEA